MRAGTLTLAVALVTLGIASSAPAATTIGSNLSAAPTNEVQGAGTFANATMTPGTTASGGMVAPASGVITGWAMRLVGFSGTTTTTMRLVVIGGNTGIVKGPVTPAPRQTGVTSLPARLPIGAGQRLGLDLASTTGNDADIHLPIGVLQGGSGSVVHYWNPVLAEGTTRSPSPAPAPITSNTELALQATVEPDVDGDGFGDESQDECVGTAGGDHGCVPLATPDPVEVPVVPPRPETTITSGPTKVKKPKATFVFASPSAGATFECGLDNAGFAPCSSPTTLRKLVKGKHTFAVRAISADGLVDDTPAEQGFKVKPKKRKPK